MSEEIGPVASRPAKGAALLAVVTLLVYAYSVYQWRFTGDDAYISYRYSAHLVDGHGLVFNPGEVVEGYTNFLWVVLIAIAMLVGLPPIGTSHVLGVASGVVVLGLATALMARRTGWNHPLTWVPALCLAANRSFGAWSTSGLETQLFTATAFGGVALFLLSRESERVPRGASAVVFALAALTRPEGNLFFGLAWLAFGYEVWRGQRSLRQWVRWSLIFVAPVGLHFLWRLSYYGAPVPNTFYAKVSGAWWSQGLDYLAWFHDMHAAGVALALALLAITARPALRTALPAVIVTLYTTYVCYVGGDRFEFRLFVVVLPFLYVLAGQGLQVVLHTSPQNRGSQALLALCALVLVGSSALASIRTTQDDAPFGVRITPNIGSYADRRAWEGQALAKLRKKGLLSGDEVLAVTGAGALPYYAELQTIDVHGLNDATIARQEVKARGEVGHEKIASWDYLVARKVAIYDVENRLVRRADSMCPADPERNNAKFTGKLRCIQGDTFKLVFATTLSDEAFRQTFSKFDILY